MQAGSVYRVRTDKDVDFIAACAQNVGLHTTLTAAMVPQALAAGLHMRSRLKGLRILSKENLDWEVWLFGNASFATTDADTERFLGFWSFLAADGKKATVAAVADTYFHYYIDGLDVGVEDLDKAGSLYIRLVNRSAAGKSANAAGAIVIEFVLEPTQGI